MDTLTNMNITITDVSNYVPELSSNGGRYATIYAFKQVSPDKVEYKEISSCEMIKDQVRYLTLNEAIDEVSSLLEGGARWDECWGLVI